MYTVDIRKHWMMPSCCLRIEDGRKGRRHRSWQQKAADSRLGNREGKTRKSLSALLYLPLHRWVFNAIPGTRGREAEEDSADRVCKTQRPGERQNEKVWVGENPELPPDDALLMQDRAVSQIRRITPELNDLQEGSARTSRRVAITCLFQRKE